jgi:hypothetical protein
MLCGIAGGTNVRTEENIDARKDLNWTELTHDCVFNVIATER